MKYATLLLLFVTYTTIVQCSDTMEQGKVICDNDYRDCYDSWEYFLCCCNLGRGGHIDPCDSSRGCCPYTTTYDKRGTIDCNRICFIGDCLFCCKAADDYLEEHCKIEHRYKSKYHYITGQAYDSTTISCRKCTEPCFCICRNSDCTRICARISTIMSLACCCTSLSELTENLNDPVDYQTQDNSLVTSSNTPKSTSLNNVTPAREMDNLHSTPETTSLNNIIAVKTMNK